MIDWTDKVQRPRLRCSATAAAIPPGERFVSALVYRETRFERLDFCEAAWTEQDPAAYLSWWRQKSPEREDEPNRVNPEGILSLFHDLKDSRRRPEQCFAYCLALLLTRMKRLRFLDVVEEEGQSFLLVAERGSQTAYRIRDPLLTADEEAEVTGNINAVLGLDE